MRRSIRSRFPACSSTQAGLSYVEVLVATVLVVIALVPAINALQGATAGSAVHLAEAANQQQLRSKMEEVLAKPFGTLYAQTYLPGGNTVTSISAELSDPAVADRRIVVLYRYDGSAPTAADSGLLRIWVGFEAGGSTLETLRGRWW